MKRTRRNPCWHRVVVAVIALCMTAWGATPALAGRHGAEKKCAGKLEKTVAVQILSINDFHGQITEGRYVSGRPVGSAPVLAAYLKAAEAAFDGETFIVHAGDLVGASVPESALLQDEPTIQFFNQLGNRFCTPRHRMNPQCNLVGTVGNHEFDEGYAEMLRLFYGGNHADGPFLQDPWQGAAFSHVCTNVVFEDTDRPLLPPFVVKLVKNIPVAFIGAVLEDTASIVTASGIAGLTFLDEAEAINRQVRRLKWWGVETIVVLLHQGGSQTSYDGSTDPDSDAVSGEVVDIVKALDSEVDVVISGHSHGFSNALIDTDDGGRILLTQAWSKGTAYGDTELVIDRKSGDVVEKFAQVVTTWADAGPGLEPDAEAAALVEQAENATAELTGQYIGEAATTISSTQSEAGEAAMGNLIADAQKSAMGTDVAFMNPGGIRADLDAGEVTWGELYTVQPFNNYLIKMELTGQQIRDLLNQQFTPYQPYDRMLQIAGLTYTWDPNGTRHENWEANDLVSNVIVNGTPLELSATYTVTVNSFLAEGGDNFTVLAEGANPEVGPIDLDALIQFVQALDQPFSYAIEGRIGTVE
ncbi:5'-nucleotidase [Desulfosarcina cetonica]|uniref:bifunctional metallophosphatase/5'-nucleotidase n=1 Tax=Desulfosarcina cetonica TaxID=90730 RepID=UPI0006D23C81|nr:bifunctional metallophosphatase/5'-nucleotidase [Desulfosarcina cetonica]VTR63768.1 5'-nucleotidase [Desulfosarcina cetonica]